MKALTKLDPRDDNFKDVMDTVFDKEECVKIARAQSVCVS